MRGATPSSSRNAIRPRTRHGATCAVAEPLLAKPPNESELRVDLINGSMIRLSALTILMRFGVRIWMAWSSMSSPI